jgi:hypothetical protein
VSLLFNLVSTHIVAKTIGAKRHYCHGGIAGTGAIFLLPMFFFSAYDENHNATNSRFWNLGDKYAGSSNLAFDSQLHELANG